jgi:cysteine-rich repeat protein
MAARLRRRPPIASLVLLLLALAAAPAHAAALAVLEVHRDGLGAPPVDGLDGTQGIAISPDGLHLYAAGSIDSAVAVFGRNATTGALTLVQVLQHVVDSVDGLGRAEAVVVSPDGAHVYVAGGTDDAVAVFSRDAATGTLGFVQVVADGVGGVNGLDGVTALAVSADGASLYAASDVDNALAVFQRDAASGALTFVEFHRDDVPPIDGLHNARAVAVSPDGTSVYATGSTDDAVAVFSRNPATSRLTFVEMKKDGVDGLLRARAVAVSPDGAHVYVGGGEGNALVTFSRDGATGALTFQGLLRDGIDGVNGLDGPRGITVGPDGTRVFVAASGDNSLAAFARDPATGALSFLEVKKQGKAGVDSLDDAWAAVTSPGGEHVYAVASESDAVTVFLTRCGNGTVDADEQCDDGDTTNGDCCSSACRLDPAGAACTSDGNGCTDDVCNGQGVCQHPDNTAPCDDGLFCTADDTCQAGACQPGAPRDCSAAAEPCVDGVCDEQNDRCGTPKADGTACNDGNPCTHSDGCQAGVCAGATIACAAQDQCHEAGVCDPATGLCSNPTKSDGSPCNDGNLCTPSDACVAGTCTAGAPLTCGAQDQCHAAGVCNPATGLCSNPAKPDGSACNDGSLCTRSDTCLAGACMGGAAVTCGAQDQCHAAGVCNPATGLCSNPAKPDGTRCDDGNACTRGDACAAGACRGADAVVCRAQDPCHDAGICDPATGLCSNPAKPDGTACDDGEVCTVADACSGGTCTAGPRTDRDADGSCDVRDVCPDVYDPSQLDRNGDGVGDACECTAPAPGRCLSGGGSRNADCLVEFNPMGGAALNRGRAGILRCVDGDLGCDGDGRPDGRCTFGVALCIGNADPRLPGCKPTRMVSLEVLAPNPERSASMDRDNVQALEHGMQALGIEIRRRGRVLAQAHSVSGQDVCSPLVSLVTPAPAGQQRKPVRRKLRVRGTAADGRKDVNTLILECARK